MTPAKPLSIDELRRRLSQPGPWAEQLRRLAADIAAIQADPPQPPDAALTCDDIDALLDLIVDAELAGQDMPPRAAAHLTTCARCRESLTVLLDTLVADSAGDLPAVPVPARPALSFLQPAADRPWTMRLRSALTGEAFGLTLALNPAYLQRLFFAPAPLLVRADDSPQAGPVTHLLLSDAIAIDDHLLAIELLALRDQPDADEVALRAIITSSTALPPNLWATLIWADVAQHVPVEAHGQVDFGRVSLSTLHAAAHRFDLFIEARPA